MKRKTSTTPCRIYSYGCDRPISGGELLDQQIQRAHRYRNTLTELELRRREQVQKVMLSYGDVGIFNEKVEALLAELAVARTAIAAKRGEARKRLELKPEAERVKNLVVAVREARVKLKAAKEAVRTDLRLREHLREIEDLSRAEVRKARKENGTYWGTYLTIEAAAEAARRSVTPPRFQRYDGSGKIAVQIMHGMPVAKAFGKDARLQIEPVPADTYERTRHQRVLASRTRVRIRAGSNDDRSPKWVELPVNLHRPLPADGVIKWAWILRRPKGLGFKYLLQIVVESETFRTPTKAPGKGMVAIDLGWRTKPDGSIRVGYIADDTGHRKEILVPDRTVTGMRKPEELQAIRDNHFNTVKLELAQFLESMEIPRWLKAQTRSLTQWRSQGRLARLVSDWKKNRFEGDHGIFTRLAAWCHKDRHLYKWESRQRDRRVAHRREEYRKLAARLVKRYAVIVLEKFDLRYLAKRPEPEEGAASEGRDTRWAARVAAPGELRQIVKVASQKYGAKIDEQIAVDSTQRCHLCGSSEPWDAAPEIEHKCAACGARWDQDYNACRNLLALASGKVPSDDAEPLASNKTRESLRESLQGSG